MSDIDINTSTIKGYNVDYDGPYINTKLSVNVLPTE